MNDKEILVFFSSILFLNIFVKLLKNLIKQDRPIKSNTYGMPSSKSTIITFIIIVYSMRILSRFTLLPIYYFTIVHKS